MVAASKLPLIRILDGHSCKEIVHPWTNSCTISTLNMVWRGWLGSFQLFLPFYLVHLAQKHSELNINVLLGTLKSVLRSSTFCAIYASTIVAAHCFFRNMLGYYTWATALLIPGILGGLSIFIENPTRWTITTIVLTNLWLEWLLYIAQEHAGVWLSTDSKTAGFMVLSGLLLYMLRTESFRKHVSKSGLWIFYPPRVAVESEHKSPCPHRGPCWKDILLDAGKFLRAGIGFQMLRVLVKSFVQPSKPTLILQKLCARKNFMLGAFLASYVAIYKTISCLLCQWRGCDTALHAAMAGFLAGIAFRLHPETTIGLSSLTTILQILGSRLLSATNIGDIPQLKGILAAFCGGVLVHARYVDEASVPRLMLSFIHLATSARTTEIYRQIQQYIPKSI